MVVVNLFWKIVYRACIYLGLSTPRQIKISFMKTFMQTYLIQQKMKRKGNCHNGVCAKEHCCLGCSWLIERKGKWFCKDYKNAPQSCKDFPLYPKELKNIRVEGLCGIYWDKKEMKK